MTFKELIPLTAALVNLALTFVVVRKGLRSGISRIYLIWGSSIVVWNLGTLMMFRAHDARDAMAWAVFLQFGVIFLPISLLHLAIVLTESRRGLVITLSYLAGGAFAAANLMGFFVSGVRDVGYAYYSVAGPAFIAFLFVYSGLTGYTIYLLWESLKTSKRFARARLKSMLTASAILIVVGVNDILPIVGIYEYPGGYAIFPFGSLAAIFYGLLVGYSVLQHQLLDIQISLGRMAAQSVRFAFLLFIGLVLMLVAALIRPDEFTPFSFSASLIVIILSGAIASILFPKMLGSGLELLERRILGDRFEYHDRVRSFIESMRHYGEMDALLDSLGDLLVNTAGISRYHVILRDEANRGFSVIRSFPQDSATEIPELQSDSEIFAYFESSHSRHLAFNHTSERDETVGLRAGARSLLAAYDPEFCFPFYTQDEPFGLLLIGPKRSGELFTATDVDLLTLLAERLSLIVNQLRLQAQIFHQQELELLGRMSRGMAHDLNNLLTPVSTYFQLSDEGVPAESLNEELLPVALRNVSAIRAYIREALFFSENLRPDFQLGRLDVLVQRASTFALDSRVGCGVEVVNDSSGEIFVELDEVLIQRMLSNIVANAIDASPKGSVVRTVLRRLPGGDSEREWLRMRIIDSGEGIAKADLPRVFTPYFTTKNRGDGSRGFGLGLAICRKIVHLHGGTLNISSQHGHGTTVQVDLPSRQVAQTARDEEQVQ